MQQEFDPSASRGRHGTLPYDPHTPPKKEKTPAAAARGPIQACLSGSSHMATGSAPPSPTRFSRPHYHFKVRHILQPHGCHLACLGSLTAQRTDAHVKTAGAALIGWGWGPTSLPFIPVLGSRPEKAQAAGRGGEDALSAAYREAALGGDGAFKDAADAHLQLWL